MTIQTFERFIHWILLSGIDVIDVFSTFLSPLTEDEIQKVKWSKAMPILTQEKSKNFDF